MVRSLYDVIQEIKARNDAENQERETRISDIIKRRASLPADSIQRKPFREDVGLLDIAGEFGKGVARLPREAGSMLLSPVAQLTGSESLMKTSQELSEEAQRLYPSKINPDIPIDELSLSELAAYTAGSTPQVAASAIAAAIPGGAAASLATRGGVALARGANAGSVIRTLGRGLTAASDVIGGTVGGVALEGGAIGQESFAR